ncbi:MAG: hypothetical protein WBC44_06460, partial [Planctomycetaceae bacterium]
TPVCNGDGLASAATTAPSSPFPGSLLEPKISNSPVRQSVTTSIHLTGGEAGACEYYSAEPIARFICTDCVNICNIANLSVEASADHDNCQQVYQDYQGICHAEAHGE